MINSPILACGGKAEIWNKNVGCSEYVRLTFLAGTKAVKGCLIDGQPPRLAATHRQFGLPRFGGLKVTR